LVRAAGPRPALAGGARLQAETFGGIAVSDLQAVVDRLKDARAKTGMTDAFKVGFGRVAGLPMTLAVQDFGFMGGSLGMAAGEAFVRGAETALEKRKQVRARYAFHALGALEVSAELLLNEAVKTLHLLLLAKLESVFRELDTTMTVLAGRIATAIEGAFFGETTLTLQEELLVLPTANSANWSSITSHKSSSRQRR